MPKHNKKRNTALLYEMLIREAVRQTINKNKVQRDKTISTLKEGFGAGTELRKELELFKGLLETKGLLPHTAEKLIQETKKEYKRLDTKKIFNEQSTLIKKINKGLSNSVFSNFVPSYRNIATLSQIFGEDINTKKRVILEETLLKKLTTENTSKHKQERPDISNLAVNKFIEKFNTRYNDTLLENQRALLNKFILSFLDGGADLNVYLNEEIGALKKKINNSFKLDELKEDKVMAAKMKEVKKLLETSNQKPINKNFLQRILKIQTLVKEIES